MKCTIFNTIIIFTFHPTFKIRVIDVSIIDFTFHIAIVSTVIASRLGIRLSFCVVTVLNVRISSIYIFRS